MVPASSVPLHHELDLSAFESDFCFSRILENVVWRSFGHHWLGPAAGGRLGTLAFQAVKALSQANFGRLENAPDLRLKGATQYDICLRSVVADLRRYGATPGRDLLIPVILLLMNAVFYPYRQWEAFLATESGGLDSDRWSPSLQADRLAATSHLRAIALITYICGPESFQEQPWLAVYDCVRTLVTVAALYTRKRLYFEEPRWLSVPWVGDASRRRSEQSQLLDIFVYVPGILQDIPSNTANLAGPRESAMHAEVNLRIVTLLRSLFRWRWSWQLRYNNSYSYSSKTMASSADVNGQAHPQHQALDFSSPARAADIAFYNSILLWLLALLWEAAPIGLTNTRLVISEAANETEQDFLLTHRDAVPSFKSLLRPDEAARGLRGPAVEILRIYEWQSRNHDRMPALDEPIYLYLFPLGMAMSMLGEDGGIQGWIAEMASRNPITKYYQNGGHGMLGFSTIGIRAMMNSGELGEFQYPW
ncbi:hypothetical protein F4778DRAFT_766145 [Xylariomycetidae sp. FL2044]|nr:hypothetical protein F4778DRAFT_766144 [Xylariomycetidae sp. FL2044]KAH9883590.1 hypothetical protein F4778DRAFT_766145 [Xylariomycetidae sp. FL2044]